MSSRLNGLQGRLPCACCSIIEDGFDVFEYPKINEKRSHRECSESTGTFLFCNPCQGEATQASSQSESRNDMLPENLAPGEKRNVIAVGQKRFTSGNGCPAQPRWEQLTPLVICVLGCNPSAYTLNGTCCYLVGIGKKRILIDAGDADRGTKEFLDVLDECMQENGIQGLQEILITHDHSDHWGGVPELLSRFGKDTPVGKIPGNRSLSVTMQIIEERGLRPYLENEDGTPRFKPFDKDGNYMNDDSQVNRKLNEEASFTVWPDEEAEAGKILSWDPGNRTKLQLIRDYFFAKEEFDFGTRLTTEYNFHSITHGEIIRTEGATLTAYHTPGHAEDHCSFMLQEEHCLFSGDTVLGWGTTFVMNLYDYMNTLHFMVSLEPKRLLPGHGPVIEDGTDYVKRYIEHRTSREKQVLEALLRLSHPAPCTVEDIALDIYKETPRHRLWMAKENVTKILRQLEKAGSAIVFQLQEEDKSLKPYSWPQGTSYMSNVPRNLVWQHSEHPELVPDGQLQSKL